MRAAFASAEAGYYTVGFGKIFHPGTASGGWRDGDHACTLCHGSYDADFSWSNPKAARRDATCGRDMTGLRTGADEDEER